MPTNPPDRPGLRTDQLERGKCYRSLVFLTPQNVEILKLVSIGPVNVRFKSWVNAPGRYSPIGPDRVWSNTLSHPRCLFDSWDGTWFEVEDPSA